jgi:uncharacterized protein YdaU (DUF1376 family)
MSRAIPDPTGVPDDRYPRIRKTATLHVQYCPKDLMATGRKVDPQSDFAYRLVLDMIFLTGDRVPDDDHYLAEVTRRSVAKWRKAKAVLLRWDLLRIEGGRITSGEALERLDRLEIQIGQKSRAGLASAEVREAARQSGREPEHGFDANSDADFYRNSEDNPLENNETRSTAEPTNYKLRKEDDDNNRGRAREAEEEAGCPVAEPAPEAVPEPAQEAAPSAAPTPAEPPVAPAAAEPFVPPPKPPRMDPNVWALIQSLTDAVVEAYGEEVGGWARKFNDATDEYHASALLKTAGELGLGTGEAIDRVREHLRRKCRDYAAEGHEAPTALKWLSKSAAGDLRSLAKARDKAAKGFGGSFGNGSGRNGNGGEPGAHTVVQKAWEHAVSNLARKHRFAEVRQIEAEAKANGDAAANALADRLVEAALGKRRAA